MMSAYYGLFPFLLLMLSTPMYKQSIKVILWMFVFFTSWSIIDAILHQFAMDKAIRIMQEATIGDLSYIDYKLFATNSMKAYASFGNYKNMALMIAGTVTMMIVNIPGGHMLARAVGDLTSRIQNFGAEASNVATDPSLRGRTARAMADGFGEERALIGTGGISPEINRAVFGATSRNVSADKSMGDDSLNDHSNAQRTGEANAFKNDISSRANYAVENYQQALISGDDKKIEEGQQNLSDLYKNSNDMEKTALNKAVGNFKYTNIKDGMEHTVSGAFDEKTGNYIPSRDEAIRSENVVKTDKNNFTATEGDVNISKDNLNEKTDNINKEIGNKNSKINNQSTFTGNTEKQVNNTSEKIGGKTLETGVLNVKGFVRNALAGNTDRMSSVSNHLEQDVKNAKTEEAQDNVFKMWASRLSQAYSSEMGVTDKSNYQSAQSVAIGNSQKGDVTGEARTGYDVFGTGASVKISTSASVGRTENNLKTNSNTVEEDQIQKGMFEMLKKNYNKNTGEFNDEEFAKELRENPNFGIKPEKPFTFN